MGFLRHTQSFYSDLSLEELTAILRFDDIGNGTFTHRLYAEAEDGFILKPCEKRFSNRSNLAPTVLATPRQDEGRTQLTLHLTPPRSVMIFWVMLVVFCAVVFACILPDVITNPLLVLVFPLALVFFLLYTILNCTATYRKTLKQFSAQLCLTPIPEQPKENQP